MVPKLRIIPLGGIGEIGKNLTVYEYGADIILVDCGLSFPEDDMFGVDIVIPDFAWLIKNISRIRALCITHGHEDHIGAVSFLMKEISCPIYCTRLTAGLLEVKLDEAGLLHKVDLCCIEPGMAVRTGCFTVEFIHVNHSIAGAVALGIGTPAGMVVHMGDFKIDSTPVDGAMIDLARLGHLGSKGVLALLSDSTNVERPGYAMSEKRVGEALLNLFNGCDKRIVVTTFASNVHRLQQIINAAIASGRRVAITGRSMENILRVSIQLDYINIPPDTIIELPQVKSFPKDKVCIITTGSQGEPMSALHRMAFGAHRQVDLGQDDRVIISASPVPGNEKTVGKLVNELLRRNCEVIYEKLADVHVSGHACQEELKLILALVKPKYFIPVHGEYRMLKAHIGLASSMGHDPNRMLIPELGRPIEFSERGIRLGTAVQAGQILVDGMGIGDVAGVILRDRQHLANDGLIMVVLAMACDCSSIISGPDIITRGFALNKEAEGTIEELRQLTIETIEKSVSRRNTDWAAIKQSLRSSLGSHVIAKTRRKPMILPVIVKV
ncbi:MAG: ribonuclease J [Oscillospiraceae bacterium]|nr:ribonuclease J [Oscillospiraceae bacterium]